MSVKEASRPVSTASFRQAQRGEDNGGDLKVSPIRASPKRSAKVSQPALFTASWGRGPDVLFLHGLGASSRYWDTLVEAGGSYRGTAPELLGFGRSPAPPAASYDVECHLDALEEILPANAVVVGHSTGAILAAALARRHPDRVRALLLLGLPAYPDRATAERCIGNLGLLARLTVKDRPAAKWICQTMCRFRPAALAFAPWLVRDLPRSIALDGVRHSWPSYSRTLSHVVVEHRAADDLLDSPMAVTLLHGRHDRDASVRFVEGLAKRLPETAELLVVDGDHHLAVRRPEVVAVLLQTLVGAH